MKKFSCRVISVLLILALTTGTFALSEGKTYVALHYGMKDTDSATAQAVIDLQNRLKELGYMSQNTPSTGGYWSETAAAVAAFQRAAGLAVDGKSASAETLEALYAANAPAKSAASASTGTSSSESALKYRDSGSKVAAMQRRLIELGYLKDTADGLYGPKTARAVAAFQQANGLTVNDNLADAATLAALEDAKAVAATSAPTASTDSGVRYGDKGAQVAAMQRRLIELGYLKDTADGDYGPKTARAVAAFQQASGLTVNGNLADAATLAALNDVKATAASASVASSSSGTAGPVAGTTVTSDGQLVYQPVKYGDRGEAVKNMQHKLLVLGYTDDMPDGQFGPKTSAALAAFQAAAGFPVDKKLASSELLELLFSAQAPFYHPTAAPEAATPSTAYSIPQSYEELRYGMKNNDDVRRMQNRLRELGYFKGEATGNYYDETAAAVKKFYHAIQGDTYHKVGQVAGGTMLRALYAVGAPTYAEYLARTDTPSGSVDGYADLRYGDESDAVKRAQQQLNNLSLFVRNNMSGVYDASTVNAVAEFQTYFAYPVNGTVLTAAQQKLLFSGSNVQELLKIRQAEGAIPATAK